MQLIEPGDFRSVKLRISLVNTSTSVEIRDGTKSYGSNRTPKFQAAFKTTVVESEIEITEFLDGKGFVIAMPTDICEKGHRLKLEIETLNAEPQLKFSVEAEVKKVERGDVLNYGDDDIERVRATQDRVTAELVGYEGTDWDRLRAFFELRQAEIEEFFRSAKGF